MSPLPRLWASLAAVALLGVALPADAAPVRSGPSGLGQLEKYLPDDADGVMVVNLKPILASPFFTKNYKTKVETLLKHDAVQPWLKDAGFDPLKDIEHLVVALGASCHSDSPGREDGPVFLALGKFDTAKMHDKLASLAKEMPKVLEIQEAAGGKVYKFSQAPFYAAVLDSGAVIFAPRKVHVADAMSKAAGKKKTKLKYPDMLARLKKFDPRLAVQGVALESMIIDKTYRFDAPPGGGKGTMKATSITMSDRGFKLGELTVTVKDDIRGGAKVTAKNKDQVKELAAKFQTGLDQVRMEMKRTAERFPQAGGMLTVLNALSVKTGTNGYTIEGKAGTEVIQAIIASMGIARP
jgi:hypothetical protein